MTMMKYSQQTAVITIRAGKKIDFIVPLELALIIFWFLASQTNRLAALLIWQIANDLYQYLSGWQNDLILIWLAFCDWQSWLITLGVVNYVGKA